MWLICNLLANCRQIITGSTWCQMAAKHILVLGLVVLCLVAVSGAPRAVNSDADLKRSVVEFLKQDREFITEFEKIRALDQGEVLRSRRQTEIDDNIPDSVETDEKPGFFDRAAKFIVDLLQRFLKWINTDGN